MEIRTLNSDSTILYDRSTHVGGITIRIKSYDGKTYLRDREWHQRKIVECGVGQVDEHGKLVGSWAGAAICCPGDKFNARLGMKLAFKRCVRRIADKKLRKKIREFYFWPEHIKSLMLKNLPQPERPELFGDREKKSVVIPSGSGAADAAESLAVATGGNFT